MAHVRPLPEPHVRAVVWTGDARSGSLAILDQTRIPQAEVAPERTTAAEVISDIQRLAVRGAPAIGVAGAYGLVLAARSLSDEIPTDPDRFAARLAEAAEAIATARPTAVNLRTAVNRSMAVWRRTRPTPTAAPDLFLAAARELEAIERAACDAIARYGAARLRGCRRILTHCNTGALVTPGLGTALAPLFALHAWGEEIHVWADETRPLLQGLRLTAWELARAGVPHAVIGEGAAAGLMRRGEVDAVILGADRVCRNGDVANKVGTYGLAVLARHHGVPFLVAAPLSTLDPGTGSGDDVVIEDRPGDLARYLRPEAVAPELSTREPAFDVTPATLVSCLLTEEGALEGPDEASLAPWMAAATRLQAGGDAGR